MHYQNILFDLYGTLADIHTDESKKELWRLLAIWYRSHGAAYTPWELRRDYKRFAQEEKKLAALRHPGYTAIDIRLDAVFEKLYASKGIIPSKGLTAETAVFFRTLSRTYIRLYPAIRAMLHELRKGGRRCYLLTNAQAAFTMPELRLLGIADLFDGIAISSVEECAKPDPHFFQAACGRYGLKKDTVLMVGNDPYTDIAGANAYGIDSVYIHSNLSPRWAGEPGSAYVIKDGDTEKLRKMLLQL